MKKSSQNFVVIVKRIFLSSKGNSSALAKSEQTSIFFSRDKKILQMFARLSRNLDTIDDCNGVVEFSTIFFVTSFNRSPTAGDSAI